MRDHSTIDNQPSQSTIDNLNRKSAISIANQHSKNPQSSITNLHSMDSVVIHYQEIALKGNNRPWFVARLARNLRQATADLGVREVRVLMGRLELVLGEHAEWPVIRQRLGRVFG